MVAMVKGGASLADVERHLNLRAGKVSRRPGNAKAYRIAAAAAIMEGKEGKEGKEEEGGEGRDAKRTKTGD